MYKILVVEDEPLVRKGLLHHQPWDALGFEVCGEAENGEEAMRLIVGQQPDVVLTDLRMPDMDGLALMDWVVARRLACRLVVISGYRDFEYAQHAMECGAMGYLLKPVKRRELQAVFERVRASLDARVFGEPSPGRAGPLEAVLRRLDTGYHLQWSIQELADQAHLSASHFMRLFKQETGLSVVDYIHERRIRQAMYLLEHTDLRVYEVADRVGFNDVRHFGKLFRSATQLSPSAYREYHHGMASERSDS